MVSSFQCLPVPQIDFGPGKLSDLPEFYKSYGKRPALVLGRASLSRQHTWQKIKAEITDIFGPDKPPVIQVSSEPTPTLIDEAVSRLLQNHVDMVIAIGGGSVLDAGKAISAMLVEQAPVMDFLEGVGKKKPKGRKLPFIAVPTTAGTGSETTNNAVIKSAEKGFKKSLRHKNYYPNLALVDPEMTLSCPPSLTATCGMDCFTQLTEAYLSTRASALTDSLSLDGIRSIARSLETVFQDGSNLEARSDMAYATLLSGIALSNAGLGTVHGLAGTLGGFLDIPHGTACGTLMAITNRTTLDILRKSTAKTDTETTALRKFSNLGRIFSKESTKTDNWYQDFFINELIRLTDLFELPTFDRFGMNSTDLEKITFASTNKFNPVQLSREDLMHILSARLR
ncbi:alcohol dehydrogenase [Desulfomarina profundi]|uniref:Alcohol dehydrogenase n=1 Tax=Desulfomarina profundi TaxID=2772557 RepID=A0A8D5JQM4_9BACT|nr:iron-containing alcohol dehydrogenase [Desulfomarina profundi]BCL62600.1 alcohol dehydrogenase [Desulfomarina profundi]